MSSSEKKQLLRCNKREKDIMLHIPPAQTEVQSTLQAEAWTSVCALKRVRLQPCTNELQARKGDGR